MRLLTTYQLCCLLLLFGQNLAADLNCEESLSFFNLSKFKSQKYTNYFTHFETSFSQALKPNYSETNLLPLELVERLNEIEFKELKLSFTFGNPNEVLSHPRFTGIDLGFDIPFAGSVFRIDSHGKYSEYFKMIKLLAGLFNSEMRRPMEDYFVVQGSIAEDISTKGYFYHTNGFQILNTNMLIPILRLLNYQNNHKFLALLDTVNIFSADYLSFTLHIKKNAGKDLWVHAGLNVIHSANSFDYMFQNEGLFERRFLKSLPNKASSLFINGEWKSKSEFTISYSHLKSLYMEAKPVLVDSSVTFPPKPLSLEFYFQKSFVHIQNALIIDLKNSTGSPLKVNLQLFFSIAEEPILHQISFEPSDCALNRFKIFTRPHKSKEGDGGLNILTSLKMTGSVCKIIVPYFQKHKNFEELDSDHLVYYLIPGAFADYYFGGKARRVGAWDDARRFTLN